MAVVEVLAHERVRLYREVLVNLTSQHSKQHTQTGSPGGSTGRVGLDCEVRVDLNHRQTHTTVGIDDVSSKTEVVLISMAVATSRHDEAIASSLYDR